MPGLWPTSRQSRFGAMVSGRPLRWAYLAGSAYLDVFLRFWVGDLVVRVGARLFVLLGGVSSLGGGSPSSAWLSAPSNKNWLTWLLKAFTSGPDSTPEVGSARDVAGELEDLALADRVLAIMSLIERNFLDSQDQLLALKFKSNRIPHSFMSLQQAAAPVVHPWQWRRSLPSHRHTAAQSAKEIGPLSHA